MSDRLIISEDAMTAVLDETIHLEAAEPFRHSCVGCYLFTTSCRDVDENLVSGEEGARCTPSNRPDRNYIIWKVKE